MDATDHHLDELKVARRLLNLVYRVFAGDDFAAWWVLLNHTEADPIVPPYKPRRVDRYRARRIYRTCFCKWPEVEWDPFKPQAQGYINVKPRVGSQQSIDYVSPEEISLIIADYIRGGNT